MINYNHVPPSTVLAQIPTKTLQKHLHLLNQYDDEEGGGLKKAAISTLKLANPSAWRRKIRNLHENRSRKDIPLNPLFAKTAQDVYMSMDGRSSFNDYQYRKDLSTPSHAVYYNPKENKGIFSIKGTSSLKDVIPDLYIASGSADQNRFFNNSLQKFRDVQNQLKDTHWNIVGHSLGGTNAMYVSQKTNTPATVFNPGYNDYTDDRIDIRNPLVNIHVRKGDPISNSILGNQLPNLSVHKSVSVNPIKNHSISSFTQESSSST